MRLWSGFGFLPLVFLLFFGVVCWVHQAGGPSGFPLALALFLAGLASGVCGWFFEGRKARAMINKATGKEVTLRHSDTLFFIPVFFWGPIFMLIALYVALRAALATM